MTDYLFLQSFVMHSWYSLEYGRHNNRHVLTF